VSAQHVSPLFHKIISLMQLYVHANMDSLYEHVPQGLLPQEYGGDAGSLEKLAGMPGTYQIFSRK
jgi:hypothetical protein